MESQAAFVGAYGAVELHAVTDVGLYLAAVVHPRHAEGDDAVGLDHTLDDFSLFELGMFVVNLLDRLEDFAYCLQILAFARMFPFEICHQIINVHNTYVWLLVLSYYKYSDIFL